MNCLFVARLGVDLSPEPPNTIAGIARYVAERRRVTVAELRGRSREHRIAHPRQEAFALCVATGRFSKAQIGNWFGGRDHTTVIYGARMFDVRNGGPTYAKPRKASNPRFPQAVDETPTPTQGKLSA